jgi:hypothetical protein
MSYEENITGFDAGFNGSREFPVNNLGDIQFSQIFNGVPQLYAGSSFTVEEVIEFGVLINNPEVIDVDLRWYPPKKYMGTWTIFDQVSAFGTYPEDRGFIEDNITKVRRYSTYVIQANADVPIALHEQSAIDDCNFIQTSVGAIIPPFDFEVQPLAVHEAVLKSRNTLTKVPLLNRSFIGRIKTIGLYVDLGCELTFINYKARIINGISVDLPEFPLTVCSVAPLFDCDAEFTNFLAAQNATLPNPRLFKTYAEAVAQGTSEGLIVDVNYSVPESGFPCSGQPGVINYYRFINVFAAPP